MKQLIFTLLALMPVFSGMARENDSLRVQLEIKYLRSDSVIYVDSSAFVEFEFDFRKQSGTIVLFRKMGREFGIRFYAASIWEEERKITIARYILMERTEGGTWDKITSHGYQNIEEWSNILSIQTNGSVLNGEEAEDIFNISLNSNLFPVKSEKKKPKPENRVFRDKLN